MVKLNHFDAIGPKDTEMDKIMQNNSHHAVQCHLRSPLSVPMESHM